MARLRRPGVNLVSIGGLDADCRIAAQSVALSADNHFGHCEPAARRTFRLDANIRRGGPGIVVTVV